MIKRMVPFLVVIGQTLAAFTQAQSENPYAVSTFECIGIYYKVDSAPAGECEVKFKKAGDSKWNDTLPLWFDPRDMEHRGSIVGLEPDTEYEIQLSCGEKSEHLEARTRSETFKVGKTTHLKPGVLSEPIHIREPGQPDSWHVIMPEAGSKTTIDVQNVDDYNVVVEAPYVIIRGLELKNARIHGVLIKKEVHDVVVEDSRITHWGRSGGSRSFGNVGSSDSAIYAEVGTSRLVLQRNLIENPRGASNDWDTGHPSGPQGITLINSKGENIIRYNEIVSTEDHGFNDAIGGGSNFSFEGSPNRDSDIYGNLISNVWDDAIESEGANMNVRIWGNYIHHTFQHVAVASTSKGPLYIFKNVFGLSRRTHKDPLGGSMIKVGQRDEFGGGRRYVFHNTSLQPKGAFRVFSSHVCPNTITRNNIFDCPGPLTGLRKPDIPSDFDYDVFTGLRMGLGHEEHGIRQKPAFVRSQSLEFFLAPTLTTVKWGKVPVERGGETVILTDPVVTIPNPAIDAGVRIPGFNDDFKGEGPDMGAFEIGNPPLRFGRHAQAATKLAPWESY